MTDRELNPDELNKRLRRVRLVACDVDGVLTDGGIFLGENEELKRYEALGMEMIFLPSQQRELIAKEILPEFRK